MADKISVIEALHSFIKTCPLLPQFYNGLGVDYLPEEATAYSIETVPAEPIVKRYISGDTHRQLVFTFGSREAYGDDTVNNLLNIGFYEQFAEWLEECTGEGNLPELGDGRQALKLEARTVGYAYNTQVSSAKYQIECRLLYFQKQ